DVQQLTTVGLSQARMRHAKIMRQTLPVNLFGMLPREILKFLRRGSPRTGFFRISALKLCCQIERVRGRHASEHLRYVTRPQTLLHLLGALGVHTIRQDCHYFATKFFVVRRSGNEFLPSSLMELARVKLILADTPPAGQNCTGQKPWRKFLQNESRDFSRQKKILF